MSYGFKIPVSRIHVKSAMPEGFGNWRDVNHDGIPDQVFFPGDTGFSVRVDDYVEYCTPVYHTNINAWWQVSPFDWWDGDSWFLDVLVPEYFYWDPFYFQPTCDGWGRPVVSFDTEAGYQYVLIEDLFTLPGVYFPGESELWSEVWSAIFGQGSQEYIFDIRHIEDIVNSTFILSKISKEIESVIIKDVVGQVLGELGISSGASITIPLPAGASVTLSAKDILGNIITGNAPIEWTINGPGGTSVKVGGTVDLNNPGVHTLGIAFGDGTPVTTTVILTDPKIIDVNGLYRAPFSSDYGTDTEARYPSNETEARVYSNREPPRTPNGQPNLETDGTVSWPKWDAGKTYVDLTMSIGVNDPDEDWRIRWEFIGPDDPSDAGLGPLEALKIDFNGAAGDDNRNPLADWEEIPGLSYPQPDFQYFVSTEEHDDLGYTRKRAYTRIDKDGRSKVRFRMSSVGGDNYQVKATLMLGSTPQAPTKGSDTTGVMTVWKLLHLERDRSPDGNSLTLSDINARYEMARVHWQVQPITISPDPPETDGTHRYFGEDGGGYTAWENAIAGTTTYAESNFAHCDEPGWYYLASAKYMRKGDWNAPPANPPSIGTANFVDVSPSNPQADGAGILSIPGDYSEAQPNGVNGGDTLLIVNPSFRYLRVTALSGATYNAAEARTLISVRRTYNFIVDNVEAYTWSTLADHGIATSDNYDIRHSPVSSGGGVAGLTLYRHDGYGALPQVPLPHEKITFIGRAFLFESATDRTAYHELAHALGMAHNCANNTINGAASKCVMNWGDTWVRDTSLPGSPFKLWSENVPRTGDLCADHIVAIRIADLSEDGDGSAYPNRWLGW